jgi:hypothetical protein
MSEKNEEENNRRINTSENNLNNCSQLKLLILGFPGFQTLTLSMEKRGNALSLY